MLRKAREGGAAAVEFALILPVLLLLVGGVIDFGNLYYNQILLSNAARDGARLVAANQSTTTGWSASYIQNRISDSASPIGVGSTATVWACATSGTSVTVTVTRTTPFAWTVLGFVPAIPTPTPRGTATILCS